MATETCMVFFRGGACDLDGAVRSLTGYKLNVVREGEVITAGRPGGIQFRIRLAAGEHVRVEASEIGEATPHAAAMRECSARFEIDIQDLDAALDEMNTLMEVQGALQDASRGFLFLPWNGRLSEPYA